MNRVPKPESEVASAQAPVGSGHTAHSTTLDVIRGEDLTGRLAIVTGGYAAGAGA